jgi:hypothetical protein
MQPGEVLLSVDEGRHYGSGMKKSTTVTLIMSGALLAGCDRYGGNGSNGDNLSLTNNTFVPGQGYWHAPYHDWYPYPYNYYRSGFGYYHGGTYSDAPEESPVTSSSGFRGSGFSSGGGSSSADPGGHSSVSRGGFGGSAHAGS